MLPPAKVIINNNRGYAICVANGNKLSGKFTFYSTIRFIGQKICMNTILMQFFEGK
jgi:hypothetical protein